MFELVCKRENFRQYKYDFVYFLDITEECVIGHSNGRNLFVYNFKLLDTWEDRVNFSQDKLLEVLRTKSRATG